MFVRDGYEPLLKSPESSGGMMNAHNGVVRQVCHRSFLPWVDLSHREWINTANSFSDRLKRDVVLKTASDQSECKNKCQVSDIHLGLLYAGLRPSMHMSVWVCPRLFRRRRPQARKWNVSGASPPRLVMVYPGPQWAQYLLSRYLVQALVFNVIHQDEQSPIPVCSLAHPLPVLEPLSSPFVLHHCRRSCSQMSPSSP